MTIKDNEFYKKLLDVHDKDFTPKQVEFLRRNNQDIILRAIPGSGKTTILAYKVKQLLEEHSNTNKIQCISYTNVTVNDLREKCKGLLSEEQLKKVNFDTFHAFCLNNIIRPFGYRFYSSGKNRIYSDIFTWEDHGGSFVEILKNFECPQKETESAQEVCALKYADVKFEKNKNIKCDFCRKRRNFVNKLAREKKFDYQLLLNGSFQLDRKGTLEKFVSEDPTKKEEIFLKYYFAFLKGRKLIDFKLIVYYSLQLVLNDDLVRNALNSSFNYVCIDEFQDIDETQFQIIKKLIQTRASALKINWMFIGDPNQSIYGFAGAQMDSMHRMQEFLGAEKEITLDQSFRCSKEVFDHARQIYNDTIDTFIQTLRERHSELSTNLLEYLKIDHNVHGSKKKGSVDDVSEIKLDNGVCFIGSTKIESLNTYHQYKPFENEIEHFENILDAYKREWGYRFVNIFIHYLKVKYSFHFAKHRYHEELDQYIFLFEKFLYEDLLIGNEELKEMDYCLALELPFDENSSLNDEYTKYQERIVKFLELPVPERPMTQVYDYKNKREIQYDVEKTKVRDFLDYIDERSRKISNISIKHLHKIKGLEFKSTILKTDGIPYYNKVEQIKYLLNPEDEYPEISERELFECVEELNKLYVMMTRSESDVYILKDRSIFLR